MTSPRAPMFPRTHGLAHALCATMLAIACGGADGSPPLTAPEAPAPPPRDPPPMAPVASGDEPFRPPGADGWGMAAGLRYLEVVRGEAPADAPLPMIVVIHGLGDRPRPEWIGDFSMPVRLVLPQAPTPYFGGFAWFEYRAAESRPEDLARGIASAAGRLARAIGEVRAHRPTRGRPLVTGFSQGGMLSFALALRWPDGFALAVPISGLLPEPLWPTAKPGQVRLPPIRALHGDADDLVPIGKARALVTHLVGLGFDARLDEHAGVAHAITPAMFDALHQTLARALAELPAQ